MKFGPVRLDQAEGAILAHAVDTVDGRLKKGRKLVTSDIRSLEQSEIASIIVARLEVGDVEENEAARQLGEGFGSPEIIAEAPFTGRVNLHAKNAGVLVIDVDLISAINRIDPAITIATLPQYSNVEAGRLVATIKIIPFAVDQQSLARAVDLAAATKAVLLKPCQAKNVGLIQTTLPSLKPATMDKTRAVLQARLAPSRSTIIEEVRVPHEADAVVSAIAGLKDQCDLLILFGASAIIDRQDVIPAALHNAGGKIVRFGMPVDPGNLLLLGELADMPVICAPGCARSPSQNGFDWVLQRLVADIPVGDADIKNLGVGGLLMEIHSRPQPRQPSSADHDNVHIIILAAGQSRRMGKVNKLLMELDGKPLVRHVAEAADASRVQTITVVTGHQPDQAKHVLGDLDIEFTHNPDYSSGLASSLRCGVDALAPDCDGALILLGDMPEITAQMIDQMLDAYQNAPQASIIQATDHGKRGNPVLWSPPYFDALRHIAGDVGARHLIGQNADAVIEVELGGAASLDIDTPEALYNAQEKGD